VFVVVRLVRSDSVSWFALFFNLSFVLVAGVIGGVLGQRLQSSGFQPSQRQTGPRKDQ
jgi:hypothetical protein